MQKLVSLSNQSASWTSLVFDYKSAELLNLNFALVVTSASWTLPTLNMNIMTSTDNINWSSAVSFTEATTITTWEVKNLLISWKLIRFDYVIAWTLPVFDFEIYVNE